jgi:hypothetical protein
VILKNLPFEIRGANRNSAVFVEEAKQTREEERDEAIDFLADGGQEEGRYFFHICH